MSIPVMSIAQMREWEKATWAAGQTEAEVIRRVGKNCGLSRSAPDKARRFDFDFGRKGHNGEDARCAREHLAERRVDVLDVKEPATDCQNWKPCFPCAQHWSLMDCSGSASIGHSAPSGSTLYKKSMKPAPKCYRWMFLPV